MWTSENNWYKWFYNDRPFSNQTGNKLFTTSFSCGYIPANKTFKEEILNANTSIVNYFNVKKPSILFSGGLDSEIVLRGFLELKIIPNVYIFRYENDYNLYDVSYAVTICSLLNVDYKIIDFNLKKFYENEAERLSDLSQIDRPRALPYCKFLESIDELPILCASDLTIYRTNDDYTQPGKWMIRCWEHDVGWSKFIKNINKPAVAEWFKWTPGLVYSFIKTTWCNNLVKDHYIGKLGINSTKIIGYRESYPDLIFRKKQTGFEKIDSLAVEFEEFLKKKNKELLYRQYYDREFDSLEKEICM
jgi:hypothetical protein